MTFYERCNILAKQKGFSLNELGKKVNVSGAAINGWKTGYPRADVAQKLAQVLGVSVEYLLTGETNSGLDITTSELLLVKYYRGLNSDLQTLLMAQASLSYQLSGNPPVTEIPEDYHPTDTETT